MHAMRPKINAISKIIQVKWSLMNRDDTRTFSATRKREITKKRTQHSQQKLYNLMYWNKHRLMNTFLYKLCLIGARRTDQVRRSGLCEEEKKEKQKFGGF